MDALYLGLVQTSSLRYKGELDSTYQQVSEQLCLSEKRNKGLPSERTEPERVYIAAASLS